MNIACSNLGDIVRDLPLVRSCDIVRSGALRVSTPFKYPNGEHVDIFLEHQSSQLFGTYHLTDYGQTIQYLRTAMVAANSTARKKEIIRDITSQLNVRFEDQLYIELGRDEMLNISDAILRLAQACVRVSDLATHQRMRSSNPFRDDIEEFFDSLGLRYDQDVKLPPVFGKKEIKMDFEVRSGNRSTYVNVLAAMNDAAAHSAANEIAIKLVDLKQSGELMLHKFVTVYNSASSAIRLEDIERLQSLSSTVSYPEESDTLRSILVEDESQWATMEVSL